VADVFLSKADLNALPPVCASCGVAGTYERQRFIWLPWWAYLVLPVLLLAVLVHPASLVHAHRLAPSFYKEVTLWLPFCPEHMNGRARRRRAALGRFLRTGLVAALTLASATVVTGLLWVTAIVAPQEAARLVAVAVGAVAVAISLALVQLLWVVLTGLRVRGVTFDRGGLACVTLSGVSGEFAQAVEHQRVMLEKAETVRPRR
jgi:hypothetical protein